MLRRQSVKYDKRLSIDAERSRGAVKRSNYFLDTHTHNYLVQSKRL
jgi:hypothetical protein